MSESVKEKALLFLLQVQQCFLLVVFGWTVTAEIRIESLSDLGFLKDSAPGVCC